MSDFNLYILLHDIRSAFNVGSIFRTADCVGAKKIFLTGYTPTPENFRLEKTALGALQFVEWEYFEDPMDVIKKLKDDGVPLYAAEQTVDSIGYTSITYPSTLCLAVGNEISGVEDNILDMADKIVEIPVYGKKNSLNVATAFGILAYQMRNYAN